MTIMDIVFALQIIFYTFGTVVIIVSGIFSLVQFYVLQPWNLDRGTLQRIEQVRVSLGQKIVYGLEFFIISDVLVTVMRPSMNELYRLAMIVAIRTALSFFISRELYILHSKSEEK